MQNDNNKAPKSLLSSLLGILKSSCDVYFADNSGRQSIREVFKYLCNELEITDDEKNKIEMGCCQNGTTFTRYCKNPKSCTESLFMGNALLDERRRKKLIAALNYVTDIETAHPMIVDILRNERMPHPKKNRFNKAAESKKETVSLIVELFYYCLSGKTFESSPYRQTYWIGDRAYEIAGIIPIEYREFITRIDLSDDLTHIENRAFAYCIEMRRIIIPESVAKIGGWAFTGWHKDATITILNPTCVIDEHAFDLCESTIRCYRNTSAEDRARSRKGEYSVDPID